MKTIKPQKSAVDKKVNANSPASPTRVNLSYPQFHPVGANLFARFSFHPTNTQPRANKFAPTVLVLALAAAFALPNHPAHAAPQGGQVVAGQATIAQPNANTTTITQSTPKAIIDWQSFSIAANQHTQFIQPSAASVTLNRVVGGDPSQILGRLTANGQVFLVNPNGIYFGKNAQIDVAGLIATTHNIRNEDFLAGNYTFNIAGKAGAAVINDGMIHIADTGIAAFVAPSVANRGVIVARLGKVMLASANGFTLDFSGDQLISFLVNDQVAQTAFDLQGTPLTSFVENAGQIQAQGGYVLLTAKAAENAIHSVINQTGSIEATTVGTHNGTIILNAGTGSLNVAGTLDASASPSPTAGLPSPTGRGAGGEGALGINGGFIETSGAHVKIDPNAHITTAANGNGKAGTWLIDPVNFTIAATGGDITGTQLGTLLNANSVIIQTVLGTNTATNLYGTTGTTGNINVNDLVNWSANKLTLKAHNNIYINNTLNGTGTASLALEYGQQAVALGNTSDYFVKAPVNLPAGQNFSTKLGSNGVVKNYTVITSLGASGSLSTTDLQGINGNLAGNYVLGGSIDATQTATWNAGAGFVPIGGATAFTGTFDGLGQTISNLFINRPTADFVGLFGQASGSVIRNVGLLGNSVNGNWNVGGLVGYNSLGLISNSYSTGNVAAGNGNGSFGGTGGLAGYNSGTITGSYATGNVRGGNGSYSNGGIGGLVGFIDNGGAVDSSYATGSVTSGNGNYFNFGGGGLAGYNNGGIVNNSYATGNVIGMPITASFHHAVGGLVGGNGGIVNHSYSTGNVTGFSIVIAGLSSVAGLVGYNFNLGTTTNSYWDTQTSGQPTSAGGTGLTTAQMQQQANFTGWDFVNTWRMTPNAYPTLAWQTNTPAAASCSPGLPCITVTVPPLFVPNVIIASNAVGEVEWNDLKAENAVDYFQKSFKDSALDATLSQTLSIAMAMYLKGLDNKAIVNLFGEQIVSKMRGGVIPFANSIAKELSKPEYIGTSLGIIKGVIITMMTDSIKTQYLDDPSGAMGFAIDAFGAALDSFLSATADFKSSGTALAKFEVEFTIQLGILSARAVGRDIGAGWDIYQQNQANIVTSANSIVLAASGLYKASTERALGNATKADIDFQNYDSSLRTDPIGERFGMKAEYLYPMKNMLANALIMQSSGDIAGANQLLQKVRDLAKSSDKQDGSIEPGHRIERAVGYSGYGEYMDRIISVMFPPRPTVNGEFQF